MYFSRKDIINKYNINFKDEYKTSTLSSGVINTPIKWNSF